MNGKRKQQISRIPIFIKQKAVIFLAKDKKTRAV